MVKKSSSLFFPANTTRVSIPSMPNHQEQLRATSIYAPLLQSSIDSSIDEKKLSRIGLEVISIN